MDKNEREFCLRERRSSGGPAQSGLFSCREEVVRE